jgi:ABC-2 type transport system ATP-binding protein
MIIEAKDLTKRFGGHEAVRGVDLSVPEGAAMALIGANGAGKTTTLRLLLDILRPDGGAASVLGVDSRRLSPADFTTIGYVSENQKLPARLTVAQFFDYLRPLYPNWDRALEDDLRERLDLPAGRRIGKLSHGMRVKTALASALAFRPRVLILDEPLSGLDPLVRDEVLEGLLAQAADMTILISSHELTEIEGFASHVAYMEHGRIVFQQPIDELMARFRSVTVTFDDAPPPPDPSWIRYAVNGHAASFIESAYDDPEALARKVGAGRIETAPMSLKDISKALMRASRKEAN